MKKFLTILGIILSLSGFFVSSAYAMSDEDFAKIFTFGLNAGEPKIQNIADDGVGAVAKIVWSKPAKDYDNNGTLSTTDYGDWINIRGNLVKTGEGTYSNNTGFIAFLREGDATAFDANTTATTPIKRAPLTIPAHGAAATPTFRFTDLTAGKDYAMTIGVYDRDGILHLAPVVTFQTTKNGTSIKAGVQMGEGDSIPVQNSESDGKIGDRCTLLEGANGLIGCIADIMYNVVFQISGTLAWIGGKFVDLLFNYSIQSSSYNASNFINTGWGVVRDICNLSFIFILLYAAVGLIIGQQNTAGIKKTIGMVIVVGVLINFSLFFTKIFIDTGNIMARVFYNSIETSILAADGTTRTVGKNGEKEITAALMSKVDPQKLVSAEMSEDLPNGYIILITLVATAVNLIAAWMFLSIGLMFVSRVVELWLKMIFSPVAFISLALPSGLSKKLNDYGWEKWLGGLMGLAFMPAIFMFFLYLITMFVDAKSVISFSKDADIASKALSILIPFVIILGLLGAAKKATEAAKGQISSMVTSVASTATGLAVGAAAGGLAVIGKNTIGRIGAAYRTRQVGGEGSVLPPPASGGPNNSRNRFMSTVGLYNRATSSTQQGTTPQATRTQTNQPPVIGTPVIPITPTPTNRDTVPVTPTTITPTNNATAPALGLNNIPLVTPRGETITSTLRPQTEPVVDTEVNTPPTTQDSSVTPTQNAPQYLRDLAAQDNFRGVMARREFKTADYLAKSSFDFRNTKLMKTISKQSGIDFGKADKGGIDEDRRKAGLAERKFAASLKSSEAELNLLRTLHKDLQELTYLEKTGGINPRTGLPVTSQDVASASAAHDAEDKRIKEVTSVRNMNYSNLADQGSGLDWIAAQYGYYTSENMEVGKNIRGDVKIESDDIKELVKILKQQNK